MPRLLWIGSPFFSSELASCGWETVCHNFEQPAVYHWHDLVRVADFVPDVLVVADKSRAPFVLGMEEFPCLTVFYSVDSHIHSWQPFYAQGFDAVLYSLRDHGQRFANAFLPWERLWWSPAFAWRDDAPDASTSRDMDCVFVGSQSPELPQRAAFLMQLSKALPGLCVTRGQYRQLYARARVILNHCEHGDLNFRVFEALGCGACLVTPRIGHGFTDLFTEGEHLLCYTPDTGDSPDSTSKGTAADATNAAVAVAKTAASVHEAETRIRWLLAHPVQAQRMREAALQTVNQGHRALHRAQAFTQHMQALLPQAADIMASRRARAHDIRKSCLRMLYLHWAEQTPHEPLRAAYLAAARE
ncbi:MAG: glycosyltransferase family 1 protein [Desulfovibrio sp.]|nr:glycosyltransferase family 1 protein [Desulfovibrio sp.]